MNTALLVAIFGAVVTAIGWLITFILSSSTERRQQRLIAQVEFTKQQLEELYGPLAFLVWEGEQSNRELEEILGSDLKEILNDEDKRKTWLFWVENDIFPRHQKIVDLLSRKTYLIEGERLSESFLAFMTHSHSWKINHERWQKQSIDYSWHSKLSYPLEFNKEVLSTFEYLKKHHSVLIGKISRGENLFHSFRRNRT